MDVTVLSRSGAPIRLTDERWSHITEEHNELAGFKFEILAAVNQPEEIYQGHSEEVHAVKEIEPAKWLVVVYKEFELDGFVITAFFTTRKRYLARRPRIWP